jgi:hypothetical protein
MSNSLTRKASLKIGPLFLERLVRHYFDRIRKDASASAIPLRQDELLYDETFSIVKVRRRPHLQQCRTVPMGDLVPFCALLYRQRSFSEIH